MIQLAVAAALTVIYTSLALIFGGAHPQNGMPWWFFAPGIVCALASYVAVKIGAILPVPWQNAWKYSPPPRRIRLSWRAAIRLPVLAPALLIPWHFLWIIRYHFELGWVLYLIAAIILGLVALVVRRRWRDASLLRSGEIAAGVVQNRDDTEEWNNRVSYNFVAPDGTTVNGRVVEAGYKPLVGSIVPIFYDANRPKRHIIACASWFVAG